MATNSWAAARPQQLYQRASRVLATAAIALAGVPATAQPIQSSNAPPWARTGDLSLAPGDNIDTSSTPFSAGAGRNWSAADSINFAPTKDPTTAPTSGAVYGSVQLCSGHSGANDWLSYPSVWCSDNLIGQAFVKLKGHFFSQARNITDAWQTMTACHGIGYPFGLADNDTIETDPNHGTCRAFLNDPTETVNRDNGTPANLAPAASDRVALNRIEASVDIGNVSKTKPRYRAADALGSGEDIDSAAQARPEPEDLDSHALRFRRHGGDTALSGSNGDVFDDLYRLTIRAW